MEKKIELLIKPSQPDARIFSVISSKLVLDCFDHEASITNMSGSSRQILLLQLKAALQQSDSICIRRYDGSVAIVGLPFVIEDDRLQCCKLLTRRPVSISFSEIESIAADERAAISGGVS